MRKILLLILILTFSQMNAQCWQTVNSGSDHSVALQADNSLWSWGNNEDGQSGDGTLLNNSSPKKIGIDTDWKTVVAGTDHTVALKKDGSLWAWGSNKNGQLGDGTSVNKSIPTRIGSATDWQTIAAGNQYTVALKKDGTLWAWGDNYFGQLGNGTSSGPGIPKQVGTDKDWKTITVGYHHTIALKTDGSLWTWGSNDDGKLGNGTTTNGYSPKKIGTDTDWKTICGGGSHTLAIKTDGSLWAWGQNTYGELGNGTTMNSYIPIKIGTSTDWKTLGAAGDHSIAIKTDGSLWTWGYNSHNELGNGKYSNSLTPVQIGTGKNWQAITAGYYYTSAVSTDGVMWTFGDNSDGQLGDGTTFDKNVPVIVPCSDMLTLNVNVVNVTCAGMHNGSATAIAGGGTAPYTYLWSTGGTSSSVKDLVPGTYTCKATDASSLTTIIAFTITEPNLISLVTKTIDACNGNNGSLTVTASGGTAPYQYSISSTNNYQDSNVFTGLSSGNYTINVKDDKGCVVMSGLTIIQNNTAAPISSAQTFDDGATVGDLKATGSNLKWYNNTTTGNNLSVTTKLQTGKYYVSQTVNGCESLRTAIDVVIKTILIGDQIPTNGLVAYYPFNGNANDVSGNKAHGSIAAAVLTSDRFGNSDSAYNFNGKDSFINAVVPNIPQGNSPRTISGWFKTDNVFNTPNKNETCIFNYGALVKSQRLSLYIYSKGYLEPITGSDFSSDDFYINNYDYSNNDWYFFTLTYNGTKLSLYVNGKFVDEKAVNLNTTNNIFRLGERYPDNRDEWFKGKIDDVGIWNRVLTPQEISALYTPGTSQISYTLIPDANFEKKLIELGIDSGNVDGKVRTSDISSVESLNISSSFISDLTGIEGFKNLKNLNFQSNSIVSVDLSKNTKLISINAQDNRLTTIDFFANNLLQEIYIDRNNLNSLNVTQCTSLLNLSCETNQLKSINLSQNKKLTSLHLDRNGLTALDISKNVDLKEVWCGENQLASIVLPESNNLLALYLNNNRFTALNVSKYTNLKQFVCSNNQLTSIDISNNTQLTYFQCQFNSLTDLNISRNIYLTSLFCFSNQLKTLDLSQNKGLQVFWCDNNQLTSLDVSQNITLAVFSCQANNLTNLNIKNGNNTKMNIMTNGFVNNPNLTCIQVDDLEYANANWFSFKDSGATFSTNCLEGYTLIPDSNFEQRLIMLGIDKDGKNGKVLNSSISKIDHLYIGEYAIKDLTGISGFTSLRGLRVSGNELTSLDLSKNTLLDTLDCSKNKLRTLNLKNGNNKNFYSKTSNFSNNPDLTCIQVDDVAYSNTNWATIKDRTASYNSNCTEFYAIIPDRNFEQKLIDLGIDTDGLNGKITIADVNSITSLDLSNSNIKDLTGLEYFTSLTFLDVSNNQLPSLDVSKNLLLETLNASSNQLTTLDLSKNTKLRIVYVVNNPLVSLNLRNGNNANFILPSKTGKKSDYAIQTSFLGLKTLGCIQVDDESYSNANWSNIKEPTTVYANTCKSLGVDESIINQALLYPNPTKGEVNINNVSLEKATVYNSLGQLVKSFTLNAANTNNTINLSGLPKGVYYIYLINGDAASAKKIIVE